MQPLESWLSAVRLELGLPHDADDVRLLLDLSRQVAHTVERPAAPLTTYLLGLAAGREPEGGRSPSELAALVERLTSKWASTSTSSRAGSAAEAQKGTPAS